MTIFSESAIAQTKLSKTLRKKQRKAVEKLRSSIPSQSSESLVVSASALPSFPVLSTASADVSSTLLDNTVAPSRFNPYQDKTLFLKGKFDRKTALQVAHNLMTIGCPYYPSDVVPPHEHANFLTLLHRRFPMDEGRQRECESWMKWSRKKFCEELLDSVPSENEKQKMIMSFLEDLNDSKVEKLLTLIFATYLMLIQN